MDRPDGDDTPETPDRPEGAVLPAPAAPPGEAVPPVQGPDPRPRRRRVGRVLGVAAVVLIGLLVASSFVRVPYYKFSPG